MQLKTISSLFLTAALAGSPIFAATQNRGAGEDLFDRTLEFNNTVTSSDVAFSIKQIVYKYADAAFPFANCLTENMPDTTEQPAAPEQPTTPPSPTPSPVTPSQPPVAPPPSAVPVEHIPAPHHWSAWAPHHLNSAVPDACADLAAQTHEAWDAVVQALDGVRESYSEVNRTYLAVQAELDRFE